MHEDGALALYTGGPPVTDTIFCALPLAALLIVTGVVVYLIRHAHAPQSRDNAAAVEEFFSDEER